MEAHDTIVHLTEMDFTHWDARTVLDAHDSLLGFFVFAVSALKNLAKCFESFPGSGTQSQPDRGSENTPGSERWFQRRRDSLVHEMLIPIAISNGPPIINPQVFQKNVGWHDVDPHGTTSVRSLVEDAWLQFIALVRRWESSLLSQLQTSHAECAQLPQAIIAVSGAFH